MSNTLTTLRTRVSQEIGDYISTTVTTALAASLLVVDTTLANYKGGTVTDYFKGWYVLITSLTNSGTKRIVTAYNATTYTLTASGANFSSDSSDKATYELHKYDPTDKMRALNMAARDLYPWLSRPIRNRILVGGNILPNSHFEDWASASIPDFYAVTSATAAATTSSGLYRGGATSALVTASAANGYMGISSNTYPRLLDLMDKTVTFHAWAYPSVADDATLVIYTIKADGTAQTLTSTTTCPASKWSLLELDDQKINDDIVQVDFRFKVGTNAATCYFDKAWVSSGETREILLPQTLQDGSLHKVSRQVTGHSDDLADDIGWETRYEELFGWKTIRDGVYKYLSLPYVYDRYILELQGIAPLESNMTAEASTMSIEDPFIELLVAQAIVNLYRIGRSIPSYEQIDIFDREVGRWEQRVAQLKRTHSMPRLMSTPISWGL